MQEIKKTEKGIKHIHRILLDKVNIITRASFWGIPHSSTVELHLKIGRYKKNGYLETLPETPETLTPKSELTLTGTEFSALIDFLQDTYLPFKDGVKRYISVADELDQGNLNHIEAVFGHPDKQKLIEFILNKEIISEDLLLALKQADKAKAITTFELLLNDNLTEHDWQRWFEKNSWVLGTEFVKVLEERTIDTANIADFLMKAYDGFVDIVEIKRPHEKLKFWSDTPDHGNYIPHQELVKAITQCSNYIYEVERESDSIKFRERVDNSKTIKPRCILVYGRSYDWNAQQQESFRILSSNYHNITILTYDHILDRAKRIIS